MSQPPALPSSKRVLDPYDRLSEVLFGLIMVLTFTGSLSIAEAGRDDVRTMLIGALGCNLAWGIIDGVFYLMGCLAERGRNRALLLAVRRAPDAPQAHRILGDLLPPALLPVLQPTDLEVLRERIRLGPDSLPRVRVQREDWTGAIGVFLLVFLSTFPVVIPFLFMSQARGALRVSNAIAIVMLFATGWVFGRITGRAPWLAGAVMVLLGAALVGLTIVLGG